MECSLGAWKWNWMSWNSSLAWDQLVGFDAENCPSRMVLPAGYSTSTTWPVFETTNGASWYWKLNAVAFVFVVNLLSISMGVCLTPTSTNASPDFAPHVANEGESCPQNEGPMLDFVL